MSLIPSSFFMLDPVFDELFGRPRVGRQGAESSLVAHMSPFNAHSMRCDLVEVCAPRARVCCRVVGWSCVCACVSLACQQGCLTWRVV